MEKIENGQSIMNTIEPEIPKNLIKDFDAEIDDIFSKLGIVSPSDSFESPIILNRNKSFFNDFPTNIPRTLKRNASNQFLNYKSSFKLNNTVARTKKIDINNNDYLNNTEKRNLKTNKIIKTSSKNYTKNNNILNSHIKLKSSDNLFRNLNKNNNKNIKSNFNENINNNNLPIICENTKYNKNNKENEEIINKNIQILILLLKEMKEVDSKLKKKDLKKIINNLLINKNNINVLYETLNQLLEFIIDILNSIKSNRTKSNNKIGNEKIILKLKNELKEKEKNLGEIINNARYEQEKLNEIINTNNIDITYLKKENKELMGKLAVYQKQLIKIESNNEILEEKMNKIIIEKTNKSINSSTSVRSSFVENNFNKPDNSINKHNETNIDSFNMTQPLPQRYIAPSEQNKNMNINKLNEKYNLSKKLNMNLLDLLKEINNLLCFYDSFLNKENGINKNKNLGNNIKNLINFMDINALIDENKTKNFHNEFMRNAEIVFNKMEEFIKNINNKTNKNNINNIKNEMINKSKSIKPEKVLSNQKRNKTLSNYKPK